MPEKVYIDREKVRDIIADAYKDATDGDAETVCIGINSLLMKLPAADVRPVVRGEWYGTGDGYADGKLVIDQWECSCCGMYFAEWDIRPEWHFCPNCGADMRGGEQDGV